MDHELTRRQREILDVLRSEPGFEHPPTLDELTARALQRFAARHFANRDRDNRVISVPLTIMLPLSGRSMLAIRFSRVDLPVPLRPIMPMRAPGSILTFTPSSRTGPP